MRNFKIVLQYEGARYQGWQRQDSTENTIQGKLAPRFPLPEYPVFLPAHTHIFAQRHKESANINQDLHFLHILVYCKVIVAGWNEDSSNKRLCIEKGGAVETALTQLSQLCVSSFSPCETLSPSSVIL